MGCADAGKAVAGKRIPEYGVLQQLLWHRSAPSASLPEDSTNFSYSGIAEPSSNTPGPDTRLPIPTLPHPTTTWIESSATLPICDASTLAGVATAATDAGGFDKPGLSAVRYGDNHAYV
jgi:hypothetical protein